MMSLVRGLLLSSLSTDMVCADYLSRGNLPHTDLKLGFLEQPLEASLAG